MKKLFHLLMKSGMKLPEPKRPNEVDKTSDPLDCPYHQCLGHTIENCLSFKDWLERQYKLGKVEIPEKDLEKASVKFMSSASIFMIHVSAESKDEPVMDFSSGICHLVLQRRKSLNLFKKSN